MEHPCVERYVNRSLESNQSLTKILIAVISGYALKMGLPYSISYMDARNPTEGTLLTGRFDLCDRHERAFYIA